MPPPHRWLSRIHAQYSALGLPRKASVYVPGLPATASAMILLCRIGVAGQFHRLKQDVGLVFSAQHRVAPSTIAAAVLSLQSKYSRARMFNI